ncbi:carbohydrate ABC transporter permease [Ochrobactrum pecoris]|nr:carbohydrate ABC transporter permease [Brucella pecoris]
MIAQHNETAAIGTPAARNSTRLKKGLMFLTVHGILIFGAIFILMPFVWMLVTSIKPPNEIFSAQLRLWPTQFYGIENYSFALESAPLLRFALNGVIVCAGILLVQLIVAIPCAYALAKLEFTGRNVFFVLILLALAIPIQVPALPLYIGLAWVGQLNTYFSMMLPFFLSAFAIFLFRQFFRSFPDDIINAARLDGMGSWKSSGALSRQAPCPPLRHSRSFSIVAHWNDLYWPLIVISDNQLAPPPLGMLLFADAETGSNYGALTAAAAMLTAPLVICFLIARKRFIQGITMTGVK